MEETEERRKRISRSGMAKRISDYAPKVYCECSEPIKRRSQYTKTNAYKQGITLIYCDRCKLLVDDGSEE